MARYVTNLDDDVYAIINLPEEVVAVVFAYVSRSPHSFRSNLLNLLQSGDLPVEPLPAGSRGMSDVAARKAADFHERWVVGYGHSSVAEHAVAHVGVEHISRLASADLELANAFLSFTEYSQRYQKPQRGQYFTPVGMSAALQQEYAAVMLGLYDAYEAIYRGLYEYLEAVSEVVAGESAKQRKLRLEKKAFEDARYVLPLSTLTSLGLTGNARALRDCLALLGAAQLPETRALAERIKSEVEKVLPTLLRHATPSPYQLQWRSALPASFAPTALDRNSLPAAQLLAYTGQGSAYPEQVALEKIAGAFTAAATPPPQLNAYLEAALAGLGKHDVPPEAFCWVMYDACFAISEANWHQLLRHCRGMRFQAGPPEIANGYTIPPNVAAAGLTKQMRSAVAQAEQLYRRLQQECPLCAPYAVTNAHRRRVRTVFDLRQLYHLANLRLGPEAQWDIRAAISDLFQQISAVHPRLCQAAKRRA